MPFPDDLLNPIEGPNPSGANLRYDPVYDKIKEARREEDQPPPGMTERDRKVAENPLVIKLSHRLAHQEDQRPATRRLAHGGVAQAKGLRGTEGWSRVVLWLRR